MKKLFYLVCSFVLVSTVLYGQSTAAAGGNINVFKDSRLDMVIQKQIYINTVAMRNIPGFRIQVILTNNRVKAMEIKSRLMRIFPDYRTYISFEAPYFRVRIGDFRTREDAQDLQDQVSKYFTDGVFTARDIINVTPDNNDTNNNDTGN